MTRTTDGSGAEAPDLDAAVRRVLGPDATLREAQRDALDGLRDRDTLLVARSGAGKTAVYAIATLLSGELTVVVSPLLALQRDQVAGLREAGLRAESVSSARGARAQAAALEAAATGELDVLVLGPEQLARGPVAEALDRAPVGLVVVDEAHCVSEWGHDFRPDYVHVAGTVERLGRPRVLALTATASPQVRDEVVERLGMVDARVLVHDADRPNIWLGAHHASTPRERDDRVVALVGELVADPGGAGLVYARTRTHVEELVEALGRAGLPARGYHAGLPAKERAAVERAFLSGEQDLVVATSAFGMGVDRADVRFVVHAGPPTSLDAYYQEVGRAGRDGEPARAVLVSRPDDYGFNQYLRTGGVPKQRTLAAVLDAVAAAPDGGRDQRALTRASGLAARTASRALGVLLDTGAVRREDGGTLAATGMSAQAAARTATERQEERRTVERTRVEVVRTYADTTDCRRRLLLELLGEKHPRPCGACDSCDAGTSVEVEDAPLLPGQAVEHAEWGPGQVSVVEEDRVTVFFAERGYVTLDTEVALESGLLRPTSGPVPGAAGTAPAGGAAA
ncbi:RecQ family ATP-dependent DNA helicase [Cellulomonas sp. GbtcB1]|uniref:RecQ family ATP-dependent DNA helicase n=1 Tax=Cellulomonas sp. GbtcB1 TaxID=2824746 RepID=UPI001C30A6D3|nr:RecQ family ATP-dependent DNA helicase [Cellulomonas sp. GbtcB1]